MTEAHDRDDMTIGPCGCGDCTPAIHEGVAYCQACDRDIEPITLATAAGMDWPGLVARADFPALAVGAYNARYTVEGTRDEYGEDRWYVANPEGDWPGDSHPTRELAQDECDRLNAR